MLGKLLKYDFKSVYKFWWIGAVSTIVLSVLGGGCITVMNAERNLPKIVDVSAILLLILSIIGIVAFSLLAIILVCVRFYKNLFTDEGYLTFTLPVKISGILNSKIILGLVTILATYFVIFIDIFLMLAVGFPKYVFNIENIKYYLEIIGEIIKEVGWYFPIYVLEGILLVVLFTLFSQMFLYCCITFASLITKKARVITSIGIYYVANGIFSFVLQLLMIFSAPSVFERLGNIENINTIYITFAIILLGVITLCFMVCALLYALQYWMLDRKLNLA